MNEYYKFAIFFRDQSGYFVHFRDDPNYSFGLAGPERIDRKSIPHEIDYQGALERVRSLNRVRTSLRTTLEVIN